MKISCGGFELNENDFELNGETLSLKNGGGSGALIVHMDEQTNALDKTWQEIHDAAPLVWYEESEGVYDQLNGCAFYPDYGYVCAFFSPIASRFHDFMAEAPNAYPTKQG